ncbi:MAG TPA: hypothetical protein VG603_09835, partial [Chitinophagales bacterium]|nr:hypothetical protein [Chitinophagales bacterium]
MMNKILRRILSFPTLLICSSVFGQWQNVGSPAFSAGQSSYTSLTVDKDGTPYLAFQDQSDGMNKITVMKYSSGSWVNVGPARFSFGEADYISLAIDSASGTLYVAYDDQSNGNGGATVRKFNGTNWDTLGTSDFTASDAPYTTLIVKNGTPYLAFEDFNNSFKTTVMKYTNNAWSDVGTEGFSAGSADYISLAMD